MRMQKCLCQLGLYWPVMQSIKIKMRHSLRQSSKCLLLLLLQCIVQQLKARMFKNG